MTDCVDATILQEIADFYATEASITLPRSRSNTELLQVIATALTGSVQRSRNDTELLQAISAGIAANPPVTNTGDAIASDVASGKTFSSAALTNVAGSSTKNATVPVDAPIQPVQACVEWAFLSFNYDDTGNTSWIGRLVDGYVAFSYADSGTTTPITSITSDFIDDLLYYVTNSSGNGYFEAVGQALNVATVNMILAKYNANKAALVFSANEKTILLNGGTNAAPTGQGLTDKATLISNGWTVTTN